jgi:uncharacterized membrane protein YphA (DoxX/SURF4 family)
MELVAERRPAGETGAVQESTGAPRVGRAWWWSGHLSRIALGLVLLVAGLVKAADLPLFAEQIAGYQILPALAPFLARAFVVIELTLAAALLSGWRPRLSLAATAALMLFFIGVVSYAWMQGYEGSCGCFGTRGSRGALGVLIEDSLFIALAVVGLRGLRHEAGRRRWQSAVVLAGVALGLVAPLVSGSLPIDGLVTDARPGQHFDRIVLEGFSGDPEQGSYLFALLDPTGPESVSAVPSLNAIADQRGTDGMPVVVGVIQGSNDDLVGFMFEQDPFFELAHVPRAGLRRFYRQLPVYLLVEDGVIRRAWFDAAPEAPALLAASRSSS